MTACYLFDIDGTLADCSHRLHHIQKTPKDWRSFFANCDDDEPIEHMRKLLITLIYAGRSVVYVSGRSDECRGLTEGWLRYFGLPDRPLYMRKAGDHRDDDIVKAELLDLIFADGFKPIMAFEDRSRVVKMYRARGIPCLQVSDGDF